MPPVTVAPIPPFDVAPRRSASPSPPAAELRGLVPGRRGSGRRIDDQAIDREGLEQT